MTKDKYDIIYRDNNLTKVKAKFEKPIEIELVTPDTIVTSVDDKGRVTFDNITRKVSLVPSESKVKITEADKNSFKVELEDYKLSFTMIQVKDEYIIKCEKNNVIEGTQYKISDTNPRLLIKVKNKKSTKNIDLKK
jgi:hypothetical protein